MKKKVVAHFSSRYLCKTESSGVDSYNANCGMHMSKLQVYKQQAAQLRNH